MALISPQINLGLQISILIILFASLTLKLKRKYMAHGTTMLTAVILNALSFLLVMMPSLSTLEILKTQPLHWFSLATVAHAGIGALAIVLGAWIVASWHLQPSNKNCIRKKKLMRFTLILWMIAFLLGFVLYAILYTSFIP
jgi:uncharacterized membrane protein YozB (DUF420 family)